MKKFYLTNNGNILNTEKGCFQTAGGQFLRRVFDEEMKHLVKVLYPIDFPDAIEEPELPIWEFLWDYIDESGSNYYHYLRRYNILKKICFTRVNNNKREYFLLCTPKYFNNLNLQIVDTDIELYLENPNLPDDRDFYISELTNYDVYGVNLSSFTNLETCLKLGNPDSKEEERRLKILREKGIEFPSSSNKRPRKPRK